MRCHLLCCRLLCRQCLGWKMLREIACVQELSRLQNSSELFAGFEAMQSYRQQQ